MGIDTKKIFNIMWAASLSEKLRLTILRPLLESGIGLIGWPQPGQAAAIRETLEEQTGHAESRSESGAEGWITSDPHLSHLSASAESGS